MPTLPRLILASASQGRRDLLTRAGYSFEVIPSNVDEPTGEGTTNPRDFVQHLAWQKAAAVATRVEGGLIIAADSVGWHDGKVIGKPDDVAHARGILTELSGTTHQLWTGVCLWLRPNDWQLSWQEKSEVRMKALTEAELQGYLASGIWEGKSGAYAIQEHGEDPFVTVLAGSVSNVVGLPIETLGGMLNWIKAQTELPTAPFICK